MGSSDSAPPNDPIEPLRPVAGGRRGRTSRALTPQEIARLQSQVLAPVPPQPDATEPVPSEPLPEVQSSVESHAPEPVPPADEPSNASSPSPTQLVLSPKARRIAWRIALGLLLAYTLSVFIAWSTIFPPSELECSWYMVLHWAFLNRAQFGSEIIFTYGPLGFLFQGFHPQTFVYVVLTWACIAAVWFVTLVRLGRRLAAPPMLQWVGMAGLISLVGSSFEMVGDARVFVACWSLVLVHFFIDPTPLSAHKVALVLVMAVVSLGKFSLALLSVMGLVLVCIDLIFRRKPPWLFLIWLAATGLLWLGAGQSLSNVVPFLRHSLEISTGYAQGEGIWSEHELRDVMLYLLAATLVVAAIGWGQVQEIAALRNAGEAWSNRPLREKGIRALLVVGGLGLAIFLLFKIGYVRHDRHEIPATTGLAALAVMYSAAQWPHARHRLLRGLLVIAPVGCLALAWFSYSNWADRGLPAHLAQTLTTASARTWLTARALVGDPVLEREYDQLIASFREHRPLPKLEGSVDAFSFIQRPVLAHQLDYRPRPVFQGYLAFTPALGRINADHFRGEHAPRWVVFDPQQIDLLYPSMLDALAWPELLGRYRVSRLVVGATILERMPQPQGFSLVPLAGRTARLAEWIDVPQPGQPVWAAISIRQTVAGRVLETLYKPPTMRMNLRLKGGKSGLGTLMPRMAGEGFLLSPLIVGRDSFTLLFSDNLMQTLDGDVVTQLRIVPEQSNSTTYAYDTEYEIRFFELRYPRGELSGVPGYPEMLQMRWMEKSFGLLEPTEPPRRVYDVTGRAVMLSPPLSRFIVEVPSGATRLRIAFGIVTAPFDNITRDAVDFNLYAAQKLDGGVSATLIWTRRMAPLQSPEDQGMQLVELPLPTPVPAHIVLETARGDSLTSGGSYWADIQFP